MRLHMSRCRFTLAAVLAAPVVIAVLALVGCQKREIEELVGTELFSLSLGKLDNQIDVFPSVNASVEKKTSICMRDGWFYVANGAASKVMVFSSYGDLISLLYDAQTNPPPLFMDRQSVTQAASPQDQVSTRSAVAYPFLDIGEIAVASDKTLYVEDSVPEAKVVKDSDHGVLLTRVVLRFDRRGKPQGYLGQEGLGGTPFPYVMALHVTASDQLVVVTRLPQSWEVFWYSSDGTMLYRVEIDSTHLPTTELKDVTPSLVNIIPDLRNAFLYLLVNLYREPSDDQSHGGAAQESSVISRVFRLNLRTRQYDSFIELPQNPPRKETSGLTTLEIPSPPSDLIGVSENGDYYLLGFSDSNFYSLQILDATGRVRVRRYVVIEDSELTFRDLRLSPTGLVYGLLVDQTKAHVTWWRSDLLLKGD